MPVITGYVDGSCTAVTFCRRKSDPKRLSRWERPTREARRVRVEVTANLETLTRRFVPSLYRCALSCLHSLRPLLDGCALSRLHSLRSSLSQRERGRAITEHCL